MSLLIVRPFVLEFRYRFNQLYSAPSLNRHLDNSPTERATIGGDVAQIEVNNIISGHESEYITLHKDQAVSLDNFGA